MDWRKACICPRQAITSVGMKNVATVAVGRIAFYTPGVLQEESFEEKFSVAKKAEAAPEAAVPRLPLFPLLLPSFLSSSSLFLRKRAERKHNPQWTSPTFILVVCIQQN